MSHEFQTMTFADQVRAIPGGEHLEMCFSCGTCTSKCMIQQKLEAEYNPRRLLRMVMMDMQEEAFKSPTTWLCSKCDLCYPACPQKIHISGVIGAVKQLAVAAGYTSPIPTVSVDESKCSGCAICVMACPYEAPRLVEKLVDGVSDRFAEVDQNKCMGCGICVAACPLGAISREGVANEDIFPQINIENKNNEPQLITFICDWCLRETDDVSILESYSKNVRIVHIPCSGRIDPQFPLLAMRAGLDGVLVCGCKPGECHYQRGTQVATCKMDLLGTLIEQMNVKNQYVKFSQIGTEERGRIRREIDGMLSALDAHREALQ